MNDVKTARPIHVSVQHQIRSLLTGENNDRVSICLVVGYVYQVVVHCEYILNRNDPWLEEEKTVTQDKWSLMTEVALDRFYGIC